MLPQIAQSSGNSGIVLDDDKILAGRQGEWTLKTLGIELEETLFTKQDFEKALKKVSRRIKK